jgi:putative pyruvate formate lyase activating enzyme
MTITFEPSYLTLFRNGELHHRATQAIEKLKKCDLCAWVCGADRRSEKLGVCRTGLKARLSSYGPHMGEEDPLRGWSGSGTIFFSRCNLRCQYCQNHDISQTDSGKLVEPEELAEVMLGLQQNGCHNINFVSPSHVVAQIMTALLIAIPRGLRLPLVYNTGGYDSMVALQLLDGVVDIYMPDMKYADSKTARILSKIPHYPESNQAAVREMHRQVGDLFLDDHGIAQRGLLIRHLVLPNNQAGTAEIVRFLAKEISQNTYLNLMDQYHPDFQVRWNPDQYPELNRPITLQEFHSAVQIAIEAGLHRLDERRPTSLFRF